MEINNDNPPVFHTLSFFQCLSTASTKSPSLRLLDGAKVWP